MSEDRDIHDEVRRQIDALSLAPARPLVVCDADEVLLQFVRALEAYLEDLGLYLDLKSFALTGNIKDGRTHRALEGSEVKRLLGEFFEHRVETVEPVDGAAEALSALAERAQIIVVSNIPFQRLEARRRSLRRHGMDYPVIANAGPKGGALARLAELVSAPIFFLDDIPGNIASVAERAARVTRMHFVADPRLARLLEPAEDCHVRLDTWPDARAFIEARLDAAD